MTNIHWTKLVALEAGCSVFHGKYELFPDGRVFLPDQISTLTSIAISFCPLDATGRNKDVISRVSK